MHRVRKYFRGSGRALAFIFVASIIWLIFDMAALRFSFNDVNSKLHREELFKREQGDPKSWKPPRRDNVRRKWGDGGGAWGEDTTKLRGVFHPPVDEMGKEAPADPKAQIRQRKRTIKPLAVNKLMTPMGVPELVTFEGKGSRLQVANITQGLLEKAHVPNEKHNSISNQNAGTGMKESEVHNAEKPVEAVPPQVTNKSGQAEDPKVLDVVISRKVVGGRDAADSKDGGGHGVKEEVKWEPLDSKHAVQSKEVKDGKALEPAVVGNDVEDHKASKDNVKDLGLAKVGAQDKEESNVIVKDKNGGGPMVIEKDKDGVETKVVVKDKDVGDPMVIVKDKDRGDSKVVVKDGVAADSKVVVKDKDRGDPMVIVKDKDGGDPMVIVKDKDGGNPMVIVKDKDRADSKVVVKDKEGGDPMAIVKGKDVGDPMVIVKDKNGGDPIVIIKDKDKGDPMVIVKDKDRGDPMVIVKDKDRGDPMVIVKDKNGGDPIVIIKDKDGGDSKIVVKDKNSEDSKVIVNNELDSKLAEGGSKDKPNKLNEQNQQPDKFSKDTIIVVQKLNETNGRPEKIPAKNISANDPRGQETVKKFPEGAVLPAAHLDVKSSKSDFKGEAENQDVQGTLRKNITRNPANVNISSSINADVENKQLIRGDNASRVRGTGMHKVRTLDVTMKPRDANAPGQFGRSLAVPKDKEQEASKRWKEGNFNVYLSDIIPLDRAIEDTRPKGCSNQLVHDDLPHTSVIICFVDEVWSTLLRSVFSVLNRSPPELIKEIILVDDSSTKAYLKKNLDNYMKQYPKVRILHLKERHGLIRARIAGANIATGDVLTFLDSHVECNVGWLEPLLEQVRINRRKVACPVIEVISDKDMSYMTVDNFQRGVFSWPMNFGWKPIPTEVLQNRKITDMDPIKCPVMAGGLFSIDKKYFYELGTYDPGLDVWGGENMEISFKIWMCGGEIEIIPCSRVGHIFRNDNPYSFPKDRVKTVERNLARVAEVWLDDYKELFYGHGHHLLQELSNIGDLSQQKELRKKLQCKSFQWYLDNVFPDLDAPLVRASGVIANSALGKCLSLQNSSIILDACDASKMNQQFNFTWLRLIKQGDLCITPGDKDKLTLRKCDNLNSKLRWLHKSLTAFQPALESHFVLEGIPRPTCLEVHPSQKTVRTNACNAANQLQKWQFEKYFAP